MGGGGGLARRFGVGALTLLLCWSPARSEACSVCGCGDPLVLASEARPAAGWLRLAIEVELLTARARSDDHPDYFEELTQLTIRPLIVISPLEALNLVLQVPLVYKSWSLSGSAGAVERARPFGLGDLDLSARWFIVDATDLRHLRRQNFGVAAGSAFPTGADGAAVGGERIDQHAQIGTGAFAPYIGLQYAFHQDPWNAFVAATYRTHSSNAYGYRFGDALLWSARFEFRRWDWIAFGLGLDGRFAFRDRSAGEPQLNTGGLVIALTPGLTLDIYGDLWLYLRVQLPVVTSFYGEQSVGPTYTAGLQWAFR